MRQLAVGIVFVGFICGVFAQESIPVTGDYEANNQEFVEDSAPQDEVWEDPFADLFNEAEDISVENQEPATPVSIAAASTEESVPKNIFFKPLTFYGHLEAEVGVSGVFHNAKPQFSGFLLFKNDLSLSARVSKNLGMNGTL